MTGHPLYVEIIGKFTFSRYRLLNQTHLDDLHETYKIQDNKLKTVGGQLLHGRDLKTTNKFTRYDFTKTGTGFSFDNANSEDTENERAFAIANNDLSDNLRVLRSLPTKVYHFANDLISIHREMINFLNNLSEEDNYVFYYHYNSEDGKIDHLQ